MKKKEFKSESKRLLELMINSIYTNKDIFLRELISNASDALDKLYYESLTDKNIKINRDELEINLKISEKDRTITISDNGCGMTKEELENNLGTIAQSGSLAFKKMQENKKDTSIIGQFGVGFYSAFMVSKKIEAISKSAKSDEAYMWSSSGSDGYTIEEAKKDEIGTTIILYIKDDNDDENYSEYLDENKIQSLVKKYSDYIRFPIKMEISKYDEKDKNKKELTTLNSMIPIWHKKQKDVKDEEYNSFYSDKFYDYEEPLKIIPYNVEGNCTYKALLYIPSYIPFNFYTKEYEKGLELYSNGVLIMEKCKDLLPDYYSFVKGIVDTEDISLNISREMLQKTKSLNLISKSVENKIKNTLEDMLKNDRKTYEKFFKTFGIQLKFGIYNNFGMDKEKLQDLIMFPSSSSKDLMTLKEYISKMKEGQESIYYACGETYNKIDNLPQVEQFKLKDYEILYLTDPVDEFVVNALMKYEEKPFVNVSNESVDLDTEEEKKKIKDFNKENKELLDLIKDNISVTEARFTNKLKKHPVCLTTKGNVSTDMERIINAMPTDEKLNAEIVLEINEAHPITNKLIELYKTNKDEFNKYTKILYAQARLIEGLEIDNPTDISNLICEIISK